MQNDIILQFLRRSSHVAQKHLTLWFCLPFFCYWCDISGNTSGLKLWFGLKRKSDKAKHMWHHFASLSTTLIELRYTIASGNCFSTTKHDAIHWRPGMVSAIQRAPHETVRNINHRVRFSIQEFPAYYTPRCIKFSKSQNVCHTGHS